MTNILFIIALTFPVAVASTVFSIKNDQLAIGNLQLGRKLTAALVLALGQGVMYKLGCLLGGTFMHNMAKHSQWMVLIICFSIAYRMVMNTLKIRKGSNLYFVDTIKHLLLLSVATGVNAFIAGLMYDFLPLFQNMTPAVLVAAGFVWSVVAMLIPFSKMKLTFNSLVNLVSAFVIFAKGFWGLF